MTSAIPTVYLIHGDDEFAINRELYEFERKIGDPGLADLNTSRLDGKTFQLDDLLSIAGAMPFLAKRRLVILLNPTAGIRSPAMQDKFLQALEKIPPTTALVLVEFHELINEKKRSKDHWLVEWVKGHGHYAKNILLNSPKGAALIEWVHAEAKLSGGQLSPRAARALVQLIGEDTRQLKQEIEKLLAYVNYRRTVDLDDIQAVTVDTAEGNIFFLVDALGNRDQKKAMAMLQRLLGEQDPLLIFGMVVRQFRLLIQVREMMNERKSLEEMVQALHPLPQFAVEKVGMQARRFDLVTLEAVYHHLLDLDEAMKSSKIEGDLALQTLVTELSLLPD
jgi:DNA polymerase-3 subunit delta